jgi:hypothetical protein
VTARERRDAGDEITVGVLFYNNVKFTSHIAPPALIVLASRIVLKRPPFGI